MCFRVTQLVNYLNLKLSKSFTVLVIFFCNVLSFTENFIVSHFFPQKPVFPVKCQWLWVINKNKSKAKKLRVLPKTMDWKRSGIILELGHRGVPLIKPWGPRIPKGLHKGSGARASWNFAWALGMPAPSTGFLLSCSPCSSWLTDTKSRPPCPLSPPWGDTTHHHHRPQSELLRVSGTHLMSHQERGWPRSFLWSLSGQYLESTRKEVLGWTKNV